MNKINLDKHSINYYDTGKGHPLVFVHGFCEDSTMWVPFIEEFSDYRIIRIDLPGFGKSTFVPGMKIKDMAESVKAVLDHLQITKVTFIGHSMGGYVGLAFAEKYGDLLDGLGLFHSHPFADTDKARAKRTKSIDFNQRNGHYHYVKQLIPALFEPKFVSSNAFLINALTFKASQYSTEAIENALEAMINRPDRSAVLQNIQCPVLFIIGTEDSVLPLEISIEQTHLSALADIHIMPKVGHMGMFEAPKKCARIIRNFIKNLSLTQS